MSRRSKVTLETINDNVQLLIAKVGAMEGNTDAKFSAFDGKFNGLETKVDGLIAKTNSIQKTVDNMSRMVARIPGIEERLTAVEKELISLRARVDNLFGLYEKLDKRIERLEHEYFAITVALKRLEQHYDRLEADRLAERVQVLEQKVAAIEKNTLN